MIFKSLMDAATARATHVDGARRAMITRQNLLRLAHLTAWVLNSPPMMRFGKLELF